MCKLCTVGFLQRISLKPSSFLSETSILLLLAGVPHVGVWPLCGGVAS